MKRLIYFFLLTAIWKVSSQTVEDSQKAIVTPKDVEEIIAIEKEFAKNDSIPAPENSSWFQYKPGNRNILLIAGHATAQIRDGKIKQPDSGTGSLVLALNKILDTPCLYTTYISESDPNYYDNNKFKDSLAKIVEKLNPSLVLDIHGSHPYRPYDVDFGTMNGKSYLKRSDLLQKLREALRGQGLINQSQDYFAAEKNQTVTKYLFNKGVPCIQLEINSNYLSPEMGNLNAQKTAQLLQALIIYIKGTDF